jgi:hypothetical protein
MLDGEARPLLCIGRSGVFGRCGKSKEDPAWSGRTPSDLEVDSLPRLGGGEGMPNDASLMAVMGGVPGNMGSSHSKWGVEIPWKTVESRETIRPRGKENLA